MKSKIFSTLVIALLGTFLSIPVSAQNQITRQPTNQEKPPTPKPANVVKKHKPAPKPTGWRNEESYYEAPSAVEYPVVHHESIQTGKRKMTPNNMCCMGDDYFYGDGDVERDYELAAYWYYRAADEGHAVAQNNLGLCYEKGYGVEKNLESAAYWYWQSAQQGNAIAQCNVGNCYQFGWGVEIDKAIAKEWYQLAADAGDEEAKRLMRLLYNQ